MENSGDNPLYKSNHIVTNYYGSYILMYTSVVQDDIIVYIKLSNNQQIQ